MNASSPFAAVAWAVVLVAAAGPERVGADPLPPQTSASRSLMGSQGLMGSEEGGDNVGANPDLFTGALSQRIPLELPPGRRGVAPKLTLTYRSDVGSGWLGVGWDLELGAVERARRYGVSYAADEYVLRVGSSAVELVAVGSGEYRANVEGDFKRLRKLTAADGRPYWEVTDRSGVRYLFGQTSSTRQDNPADASQIFRWCLERVEDANGNYYTVAYFKDQGAIYPDTVSYTGNVGLTPSVTVRFWRDAALRADVAPSYTPNFAVKTVYRLQSIEVKANGAVDRIFALDYAASGSTRLSQLASVRRIDAYGSVGAGGVATGTALPPESFGYTAGTPPTNTSIAGPSVSAQLSTINTVNYDLARLRYGDFNGDGRTDIAYVAGFNGSLPIKIFIANGTGFNAPVDGPVRWVGGTASAVLNDVARIKLGDFNGDGRTDILTLDGTSGTAPVSVYLANADGRFPAQPSFKGPWVQVGTPDVDASRVMLADFNGDGKSDFLYVPTGSSVQFNVFLSTGSGFGSALIGPTLSMSSGVSSLARIKLGDFNGDGKTEIALVNGIGQTLPITIYGLNAAGTGLPFLMNGPTRTVRSDAEGARIDASRVMTGDVNADGKTDFLALEGWGTTQPMSIYLATGTGFASSFAGPSRLFSSYFPDQSLGRPRLGDFNGDGKTDIAFIEGDSGSAAMSIYLSEGYRYGAALAGPVRSISGGTALAYELNRVAVGDFDGDGRTDVIGNNSSGNSVPMSVYLAQGNYPDLLASSSNGIGRTNAISFQASTAYANTQLPLPVQTVRSVTADDGNGVSATTNYSYAGGYYHFAEREFRGFNRVDVTGPAGPDGEIAETRYWFHQGNDGAIDVNNPAVAVGWMKGKPYRFQTWDLQQSAYSETLISYWSASAPPYFAPKYEVWTQWCEQPSGQAPSCARSTRTTFAEFDASGAPTFPYDAFGNCRRENQYGDELDANDDRTIVRSFSPNTAAWIVGLLATEQIFAGAGETTALSLSNQISGTSYLYDGTLNPSTCDVGGASATPTRGNPTKSIRLLKGGTDPEDWTGYDAYGNVICASDADRRVTSYGFDGSATFRTRETNAKGHVTTTQFYGVDGVAADTGRFGEPKKVTDPNLSETSYEYDGFGRKVKEEKPPVPVPLAGDPYPGLTVTTSYFLGSVGANRIETLTSAGQWSSEYFDGLGRTWLMKTKGSSHTSARVFATKTVFDSTGTTQKTSLPYEDVPGPTVHWTSLSYDAKGRVISVTKPDGTRSVTCYRDLDGSSAALDANGHRRRQLVDVRGNLIRVDEYTGTFPSCTTTAGSPYATTRYVYDRMGRLTTTTDAMGAQFATDYDTLGRRTFSSDPDLGTWYYGYTQAGDVQWQQDANGTGVTPYRTYFQYDELHRLTLRDYPAGVDDSFVYDGPSVPYSKGHLTLMTDASGTAAYAFDAAERPWRTVRTIDGVPYTTFATYDSAGRVSGEVYPDATNAQYEYDADGFPWKTNVSGVTRATLAGYNPLAQVGSIAYGNGVVTQFTYNKDGNNRLRSAAASSPSGPVLSLAYAYDNVRNIVTITDNLTPSSSQTFAYDELNRLTSASSAATGALGYAYDPVGNVTLKEGVSYAYDPIQVHAVRTMSDGHAFTYDSNGNLLADGTRTFEYDFSNRPLSIATTGAGSTVFTYDGNGQRAKKQTFSATTVTTTTYVGRLFECTDGTCYRHVYAGAKRIALIGGDGTVRYYHGDHLDSTRVVTDGSGSVIERIDYRPFGQSATSPTKYRFTSKEFDAETGLYFYGARYYSPDMGRFISPDPSAPRFDDPQSLNRYAYARNNPVFFTDPSGYAEYDALSVEFERMKGEFLAMWASVSGDPTNVTTGEGRMTWSAPDPSQGASGALLGLLRVASFRLYSANPNQSTAAAAGMDAFAGFIPFADPVARLATGQTASGAPASRGWAAVDLALQVPLALELAGVSIEASVARNAVVADGVQPLLAAPTRTNPWLGRSLSTVAEGDMEMYRVWGGASGQRGKWLTPFAPGSSAGARSCLALPPENAAEFVSPVKVPAGTRFQFGQAASAFDQPGGGWQVELLSGIPDESFGPGVPLAP
jgi:RHS repeat-associated protein